jgi:NADPH:quinone reductase-like Zn-dependent oxidoreductase
MKLRTDLMKWSRHPEWLRNDVVASLSFGEAHSRDIDYATEEPLRPGADYDVIFDTLGVISFAAAKPALSAAGNYLCPVLTLGLLRDVLLSNRVGQKRALFSAAGLEKPQRLRAMLSEILTLIEQDRSAPVMDRIYPLADLVEAHAYVEAGHKRGNVVVMYWLAVPMRPSWAIT